MVPKSSGQENITLITEYLEDEPENSDGDYFSFRFYNT
jgi:hypothetical protein